MTVYPPIPPSPNPCTNGYHYVMGAGNTTACVTDDMYNSILSDLQSERSKTPLEDEKQCHDCIDCGVAGVKKECSKNSNTQCNDVCKPGTYSTTGFEPCKPYTSCKGGVAIPGTFISDNTCKTPCPTGTFGTDNNYGPPCYDPCPTGTYSHSGYGPQCFDCQDCGSDVTNSKCSSTSNALCDGKQISKTKQCPTGYFSPDNKNCYKCQICDGGTVSECSANKNTECVTCEKDYFYGKALSYYERDIPVNKDDLSSLAYYRKILENEPDELKTIGCHKCYECPVSGIKEPCTKTSDAVCKSLCEPGKTYSSTGFEPCKESKKCEFGIAQSSYTSDNICKKKPKK